MKTIEAKMYHALRLGDAEIVAELVEGGFDPNYRFADGDTPLGMAIFEGDANIVKLLVSRGADPNALIFDDEKILPLHYAVDLQIDRSPEDISVIHALVQGGADATIRDDDGESALDIAEQNRLLRCAAYLQYRALTKAGVKKWLGRILYFLLWGR